MIIHEYETTLIYHPEAPETEVTRITERIDGVIGSFEGHKLFHDHWGVRKLAYPIQKQARGNYFHMGFVATAECIAELERILRIEAFVVRFLTVRLFEDVDLDERQLAATNRQAVMTADSADEEDDRGRDRDRDRDRGDRDRRDRRPPRPARDYGDDGDIVPTRAPAPDATPAPAATPAPDATPAPAADPAPVAAPAPAAAPEQE